MQINATKSELIKFNDLFMELVAWEDISVSVPGAKMRGRYYKFTDIQAIKADAIDLPLKKCRTADVETLQWKIQKSKKEFIKVRIPLEINVDFRINYWDESFLFNNNNNNSNNRNIDMNNNVYKNIDENTDHLMLLQKRRPLKIVTEYFV